MDPVTSEVRHVVFESGMSEFSGPVDTLEKAIDTLDSLGLCMNWGVLIEDPILPKLIYEGWTYRHTPERYVKLPFDPESVFFASRFEELLELVFTPFIFSDSVHRSLVHVKPGKDFIGQECFFVTAILIFSESAVDGTAQKIIADRLRSVADDETKLRAIDFCLD
ncbi:MAG: hypothetical protein G01um101420_642 [Parcubacteria group bacterium Gr01-1014_20]|nr:MAG: hypothetical protein G01um101420_642 [Parcubacteria group bacterium Gr01-1014_20]